MKISECLASDRPDMAVSEWLQHQSGHHDLATLPESVADACRADQFLMEVNNGGFEGFFTWANAEVAATPGSLRRIGLERAAEATESAIKLLGEAAWPVDSDTLEMRLEELQNDPNRSSAMEALSEKVIEASQLIESATHAFVRQNLAAFEPLDF